MVEIKKIDRHNLSDINKPRKFSAVFGTGMGTMREGHTQCAKGTRMAELENSKPASSAGRIYGRIFKRSEILRHVWYWMQACGTGIGGMYMDLWFSELHTPNVKLSIRVDRQLYSGESELQRIDVFESPEFGRFLALDGYIMLTEKDEFIYHEMIAHVPMAVHPHVERVLVIGAGDGGVVRELAKYPEIEYIDLVEIDRQVIQVCRDYLPQTACKLDDERVYIHYEDGLKFVRSRENEYDLIIVDSTDPFGPGEGLFTKEFYGNCYKALREDGIMVNQHESPFYEADATACMRAHKRIVESFPISRVYQAHIPTYPSGHWLFGFASKRYHPVRDMDAVRWMERGLETRYYTPKLHAGAFCLPAYVEKLLRKVEFTDNK